MPHHANHHHHAAHEAREAEQGVATDVTVVYVTAAPTFAGPIGSYSTPSVPTTTGPPKFFDGGSSTGVQNAPLAANPQQGQQNKPASVAPVSPSMILAPSSRIPDSALPSDIQSQPSSAASSAATSMVPVGKQQTTLASSASSTVDGSSKPTAATGASAQSSPSTPAAPQETKSDGGMSGGAKAGIAIGMILLVAILAVVGFLFYRKKKSMDVQKQQLDDEKNNQVAGLARQPSMTSPNATAPRLSLKPSNDSFGPEMNEKQAAAGGLAPVAAPTARGRTPEPQSNIENEKVNPFGDHAKLPENSDPTLAPKPLNISRPSTPTQGEKNVPAPVPAGTNGPAAGGSTSPNNGPNGPLNVHRVQLDFAPSMEDELELRQGQLVRMLHEYDDGWCLCVRLDRSQQGVCPRSCISKLPVKPRPQPPPGQRPKGPPPSGSRPGTPQGPSGAPRARANSNAPRPETPTQGPFGEGQYRVRSNTVDNAQRRQSPTYEESMLSNSPNQSPPSSPETKQAPVGRKPAPGQAV